MTDVGGDEPSAARRPEVQRPHVTSDRPNVAQRAPSARRCVASGAGRLALVAPGGAAEAAGGPAHVHFLLWLVHQRESRARTGSRGVFAVQRPRLRAHVVGDGGPGEAQLRDEPAVKAVTAVSARQSRTHAAMASSSRCPRPSYPPSTRARSCARTPIAPELVKIDAPRCCLALGLPISLPENAGLHLHPSRGAPTAAAPVIQSCLDVMLLGCAEYGEAFRTDFLRTTKVGKEPGAFVDDRALPLRARLRGGGGARRALGRAAQGRVPGGARREGEGVRYVAPAAPGMILRVDTRQQTSTRGVSRTSQLRAGVQSRQLADSLCAFRLGDSRSPAAPELRQDITGRRWRRSASAPLRDASSRRGCIHDRAKVVQERRQLGDAEQRQMRKAASEENARRSSASFDKASSPGRVPARLRRVEPARALHPNPSHRSLRGALAVGHERSATRRRYQNLWRPTGRSPCTGSASWRIGATSPAAKCYLRRPAAGRAGRAGGRAPRAPAEHQAAATHRNSGGDPAQC